MLAKVIEFSLNKRLLLGLFLLILIGAGVISYLQLPVDAFPDISPIMVPVFAEAHGMAPEEVERLITFPIETAMNGLPGVTTIRSTSAFGMAVIYVYFTDDTDIYFARQLVSERLGAAMADLPEMHEPPGLGPITTGLGQIFMYYLTADSTVDSEDQPLDIYLRTINDWVVKYQLGSVRGVTEVLSMGGNVLQFQVKIDPFKLIAYDLTLNEVVEAIEQNNRNVGGQFIIRGREEFLVRGLGLIENSEQLAKVKVKDVEGVVVRLEDIAIVEIGPEIRRGVVLKDGVGEVVTGIVLKLYGENTSQVIDDLYAKVESLQASLPQGVKLTPFYEQAHLVSEATGTVKEALLIGIVLIVIVLLLFLGDYRSALVVTISLPMSIIVAILMMRQTGLSANLMSLGGLAIAIGMMVDGAVVMTENIWRHLAHNDGKRSLNNVILFAANEVARPITFAIMIIILVFLPLFTLEGVEGKMFSPMAFTITFGLIGSLIFTFTLIPFLASILFKNKVSEKDSLLVRLLKAGYKPSLFWVLEHRNIVISGAVVALIASLGLVPSLGTEFVPTLEEGSLQVGVIGAPSTSLEEMTRILQIQSDKVARYEEVTDVVTRIGRPEAGSHPHPVNTAEIHLELKPFTEWSQGRLKQDLIEDIRRDLEIYPGVQISISQPIQNMFDELISGVKAELAVKLFGEDMDELRVKGEEIKDLIATVPGVADLSLEQSFGQPQVQIDVNESRASRYGLGVDDILETVELGIGGEVIGQVFQQTRRFGILVRFDERFRYDIDAISNLRIKTPKGALIPISDVADIREVIGPIQINREKNQRRIVIQANIEGRDLGSVVEDIQETIKSEINLAPGYFIEYGGQFENQRRAMARLAIIVPITMFFIFILLYSAFNTFRHAILIYLNIPFALIGGIVGLFVTGQYLSVPASIGFIALFGNAVQNGIVMVSYFNELRSRGQELNEVIINGALLRLRPVLMTAMTTILGLIPLLLATGIGSEVQKPLATVVVSGLFTSTILTLFLLPSLYGLIENRWGNNK
ncbi:efflux RND transporter permease subunit [Calditrichota bacterium]